MTAGVRSTNGVPVAVGTDRGAPATSADTVTSGRPPLVGEAPSLQGNFTPNRTATAIPSATTDAPSRSSTPPDEARSPASSSAGDPGSPSASIDRAPRARVIAPRAVSLPAIRAVPCPTGAHAHYPSRCGRGGE